MTAPQTPIAQVASSWTIVSQCKSDRVVYFTDDPQYQPPMEGDWYYCSIYQGVLPPDLTLRNCWGWRFRGSQFSDAREPVKVSAAEKLLDNNRNALLRLLKDKIDEVRKPFAPTCLDGHAIRERKLLQAKEWLAQQQMPQSAIDVSQDSWAFLSQVAHAHACAIEQAAKLIVTRAADQERMWLQTERFREQMTQLIKQAHTQAQLMEMREWLLDAIYPELSGQFKYPVSNTEPIDPTIPLSNTARLHEITRLKSQLREVINTQRKHLHTAYVLGEQVWQHKLKQAQQWLSQPLFAQTETATQGYELLTNYAQAKGLEMKEAAMILLDAASAATQTLLTTETTKDQLLFQIENLKTLADIQDLDREIGRLAVALPFPNLEIP